MRPEHVQDPPAHVEEVLDALPPRSLTPAGGSTRAHHAFTHTVHGGLGRVAACVFDALDDGAHGGLSVRQIAALTGLRPRTVLRHLVALQAADLATTGGSGRTWSRSLSAGDPPAAGRPRRRLRCPEQHRYYRTPRRTVACRTRPRKGPVTGG